MADNIKNSDSNDLNLHRASMSDKDFNQFSDFIHKEIGIKMPPVKKTMLESRLQKRLRSLGMKNYTEYCQYVFSPNGFENELVHLINVVTTNKTDFFREPAHFEYLAKTALPELIDMYHVGIKRPFMLWSAGCSTGEEPYTLTIVLSEFGKKLIPPKFDFSIIATDISTRVLDHAKTAIYEESRVEPVPMELKKKYLLRSKDRKKGVVRIVPELRSKIRFRRLNFMDGNFGFREQMDIIFCRNVIIYFDRPTQETLLNKFCNYLIPGGYVFMGHSETLSGLDVPLIPVAPTVYRKPI